LSLEFIVDDLLADVDPRIKDLVIDELKKYKNVLAKIIKRQDIYDQFVLSLTYNTNSIEGSTLTENETAAILFDNISLKNKDLSQPQKIENRFFFSGAGSSWSAGGVITDSSVIGSGITCSSSVSCVGS